MDQFFIICAKYLFVLPLLIAGVFFIKQPRKLQIKIILFGGACAIIAYVIALLAGQLYFDPRPFVQFHFKPLIEHDTENGFPSDHVLLVATVAAVVSVFNKRLSVFLWICTLIIAFARVYVGVHHYRDVIMSIAIASLVTFILYLVFKKKLQSEIVL